MSIHVDNASVFSVRFLAIEKRKSMSFTQRIEQHNGKE